MTLCFRRIKEKFVGSHEIRLSWHLHVFAEFTQETEEKETATPEIVFSTERSKRTRKIPHVQMSLQHKEARKCV